MKKILSLSLFVLISCSQEQDITADSLNEYSIEDINIQLQKITYQIEDLQTQVNLNSINIENIKNNSSDNRLTRDNGYRNNEMSDEMLQQISKNNIASESESTEYVETYSLSNVSNSDENPIEKIKQLAKELQEDEDEQFLYIY